MVSMVGRGPGVGCIVRVPAGNRWHTQIRIILRGFNKRIIYIGQSRV